MSEFSIENFFSIFGVALLMIASIFPVIIIYCLLFRRAIKENMDKRVLITSVIMVIGALCGNFVMLLARYYALRTSIALVFMSIFATAMIWGNLKDKSFTVKAKKIAVVFILLFAIAITFGLADNIITAVQVAENNEIIEEALASGVSEVTLYRPVPFTKYNGIFGLRYLDITSHDSWPNIHFAKYYGLDRVYGKSYFGDTFGFW